MINPSHTCKTASEPHKERKRGAHQQRPPKCLLRREAPPIPNPNPIPKPANPTHLLLLLLHLSRPLPMHLLPRHGPPLNPCLVVPVRTRPYRGSERLLLLPVTRELSKQKLTKKDPLYQPAPQPALSLCLLGPNLSRLVVGLSRLVVRAI